MNFLKRGDISIDVKRLQNLLNRIGLVPSPKLTEDGHFGDKTLNAVIKFQALRGIKADGIVGMQTWAALGQHPITKNSAQPTRQKTPWMATATAELGVHENSLAGKHESRIVEYHSATSLKATDDETPWCSSFVNWVMKQSGYVGTNSALAKSWIDWGNEQINPREGSITIIQRIGKKNDSTTGSATGYHVAFLKSISENWISLLGGNQSDKVKISNFSLMSYKIIAYRWPS
jgi:uncharacterized protein (TIGR02594 family)